MTDLCRTDILTLLEARNALIAAGMPVVADKVNDMIVKHCGDIEYYPKGIEFIEDAQAVVFTESVEDLGGRSS